VARRFTLSSTVVNRGCELFLVPCTKPPEHCNTRSFRSVPFRSVPTFGPRRSDQYVHNAAHRLFGRAGRCFRALFARCSRAGAVRRAPVFLSILPAGSCTGVELLMAALLALCDATSSVAVAALTDERRRRSARLPFTLAHKARRYMEARTCAHSLARTSRSPLRSGSSKRDFISSFHLLAVAPRRQPHLDSLTLRAIGSTCPNTNTSQLCVD
jgi:hypothetical protein